MATRMPDVASPLPDVDFAQPIASMQAEQLVLGTLLAANRALQLVEEVLQPEHFYVPGHGRIYQVIRDAVSRGQYIDALVANTILTGDPAYTAIGGQTYLTNLFGQTMGQASVRSYADMIRDAWVRRELADASRETALLCHAPGDAGAAGAKEYLEDRLLRIDQGLGDETPSVSIGDAVADAVSGAREASLRKSPLAGITTGYAALDRMTTGLLPSTMVLLAARTSMGKTGLGLGIAMRTAAAGHRVGFYSGEMAAKQLGARAAAAAAWLPTTSVFTGRGYAVPDEAHRSEVVPLTQEEWRALDRAAASAARLPLWIDARPSLTVAQLRARARREKRTRGLDLLVIDYVGLLLGTTATRGRGRYEEMTEISRDVVALSKELDIPILVLAQLNRGPEQREDKRPNVADLRDSGALEQDANVVMMLHRDHYYLSRAGKEVRRANESEEAYANRLSQLEERTANSRGVAEVLVLKNRQGPTGTTRLRFVDRTTWFFDEGEAEYAPAWPNEGGI